MTDPRLAEALEQAAEMLAVMEPSYIIGFPRDGEATTQILPGALEGWAEATQLLYCWHQEAYEDSDGSSLMPPVMHDGICDAACGDPCKPCKATIKFCNAMLGERDGVS